MTKAPQHVKSPVPLVGTRAARRGAPKPDSRSAEEELLGPDEARTPSETADYVAQMSTELAGLARSAGLGLVAYLLEMSAEEARQHGQEDRTPSK
jgi:hypothetical protein